MPFKCGKLYQPFYHEKGDEISQSICCLFTAFFTWQTINRFLPFQCTLMVASKSPATTVLAILSRVRGASDTCSPAFCRFYSESSGNKCFIIWAEKWKTNTHSGPFHRHELCHHYARNESKVMTMIACCKDKRWLTFWTTMIMLLVGMINGSRKQA